MLNNIFIALLNIAKDIISTVSSELERIGEMTPSLWCHLFDAQEFIKESIEKINSSTD